MDSRTSNLDRRSTDSLLTSRVRLVAPRQMGKRQTGEGPRPFLASLRSGEAERALLDFLTFVARRAGKGAGIGFRGYSSET